WSYVKKKQSRVTPAEHAAGLGEAYAFVSFAMPTHYVITWAVGKRDQSTAITFEADTRARCAIMPGITTDGLNAYPLRITPAMAMGVTSHPWDLDEFLDRLLAAEPCGVPEKQPLLPRVPTTTARALPNGRGFLRIVPPSGGGAPGPAPAPSPP